MEVKLTANFPGGTAWSTYFLDTDGNPISGDMVSLGKQDSTTVKLAIFCTSLQTSSKITSGVLVASIIRRDSVIR